jgi:uncharacterized membrane protein
MLKKILVSEKYQKYGLYASIACAIHCTILPFFLIFIPTIGMTLFINDIFEWLLLAVSLIFNLTTICYGYTKHKSLKTITFLGIGIVLTLVAHLLNEHNHQHFEFNLYNLFIILGGVLICVSNYLNHKLCTNCKKCSINHD